MDEGNTKLPLKLFSVRFACAAAKKDQSAESAHPTAVSEERVISARARANALLLATVKAAPAESLRISLHVDKLEQSVGFGKSFRLGNALHLQGKGNIVQ